MKKKIVNWKSIYKKKQSLNSFFVCFG